MDALLVQRMHYEQAIPVASIAWRLRMLPEQVAVLLQATPRTAKEAEAFATLDNYVMDERATLASVSARTGVSVHYVKKWLAGKLL